MNNIYSSCVRLIYTYLHSFKICI